MGLDTVDLDVKIEREFCISLPNEECAKVDSVGD